MKKFQAVFHKYGEHIHVPIEAESQKQAFGLAKQSNPMLASWPLTLKSLAEGEEAKDDRAILEYVEPRMGRPSQGRERRLQFAATAGMEAWLETRRIQEGKKSLSEVVFEIIHQVMEQEQK